MLPRFRVSAAALAAVEHSLTPHTVAAWGLSVANKKDHFLDAKIHLVLMVQTLSLRFVFEAGCTEQSMNENE